MVVLPGHDRFPWATFWMNLFFERVRLCIGSLSTDELKLWASKAVQDTRALGRLSQPLPIQQA